MNTVEVALVVVASVREWWFVLAKKKAPWVNEAPYVGSGSVVGD